MFAKNAVRQIVRYLDLTTSVHKNRHVVENRWLHVSAQFCCDEKGSKNHEQANELTVRRSFENMEDKTKSTYLDMVKIFIGRDVHRRGHVEFIYSALKNMKTYGVQKDLEVYKALVDVLPKGKFIPQNIFQAEFMHYPKQQQCIIDLLEQMEDNGVMPDYEMEDILMNIFGRRGYPLRKFWRMMYWMPKFKNLSPWPVPNPAPNDALELAQIAITTISGADIQSVVSIYQTSDIKDSVDDTWIVGAQSPTQRELLARHALDEPIYVEGSFCVWLRDRSVSYFVLRTKPKPLPKAEVEDTDDVSRIKVPRFKVFGKKSAALANVVSVHEQEDGVIYGVCATGTSSRDSLLSWIRHLEKENPTLSNCPIVFTLRAPETEVAAYKEDVEDVEKIDK